MAATDGGSVASKDIHQLAKLAIHGCYWEVRQLATEALVKAQDERGRTVLMLAADMKWIPCPKCMELLLHLGADPSAADTAGDTAAHLAARRDNLRLLALLPFESKFFANADGDTPLMDAVQSGSWHSAKHLLHLFRQRRHCEMKEEILGRRNRQGLTAVDIAMSGGRSDFLAAIEREMRLVVDIDGYISGLTASEEAERQELARLARSGDGASLLLVATRVNCDLPDTHGQTALMWAVQGTCDEASLRLLARIADPTCADLWTATCLHHAAQHEAAVAVRVLMAAGAHANARDVVGRTPLVYAVIWEAFASIVPMMLPASDWGLTHDRGCTALSVAKMMGHGNWTDLLCGYEGKSYFDESPMTPCCRHSLRCLTAESVARLPCVQLPSDLVDFVSRHGFGQGGCSSQFGSDDPLMRCQRECSVWALPE